MGGLGLMMTPLMTESLGSLPEHLYSHGSAILATLQQLAGALGTAVFIAVATASTTTAGSASPDAAGIRTTFMVAGCVGLAAFVGSLFVKKSAGAVAAHH